MAKAPTELKRYKSYSFGSLDHDPIIDQMATLKADEGLSDAKISELTGLSVGTLSRWFNRTRTPKRKPTMRPMFSSVMAFTRGVGYDLRLVRPERKVSASTGIVLQRNIRAKAGLNTGAELRQ